MNYQPQYLDGSEVNVAQPQEGYAPLPQYQYPYPPAQEYPAAYPGVPMPQPVPGNGKAVAGLVLGIISMFAWFLPIIGLPVSIVGLILAAKARRLLPPRGMITAGYVLCIIGLSLSAINAFLGVLMAMH